MNSQKNLHLPKESLAIVGAKNSGKTYAAKTFVKALLNEEKKFIIFDSTGSWILTPTNQTAGSISPVILHADFFINEDDIINLGEIISKNEHSYILDISHIPSNERQSFCAKILAELYHNSIEKIHIIFDSVPIVNQGKLFNVILAMSQNSKQFPLIIVSELTTDISLDILFKLQQILCFRENAPKEIETLKNWMLKNCNSLPWSKALFLISQLPNGESLLISEDFSDIKQIAFINTYKQKYPNSPIKKY